MFENLKIGKTTLVLLVLFLLVGSTVSAQEVKLTAATINPESSLLGEALITYADRVEKNSNNEIQMNVYPGGQLGDASSLYQSVISGDIDIIYSDLGWFAENHPEFNILESNYIFRGEDHYKEIVNTPGKLAFFENMLLDDPGLKTLFYEGGMERNIISTFPIESIEDLDGKTMRSKSVSTNMDWWKALGANPVPVAFQEVYTAVQTGVVNGSQNSLDAMLNMRFVEVNDYLARTQHYIQLGFVVMNNERFESLSEKHQNILLSTGKEVQKEYINKAFNESAGKVETMKNEFGIEVTHPDREPFIEVSREQMWDIAEKHGITEKVKEIFDIEE